jgi:hypothetical protein
MEQFSENEKQLRELGNKEFPNPFPDRVKCDKIRVAGFLTLMRAGLPFSKIPADIQPTVKQYLELRRRMLYDSVPNNT